ncbi:hypothetical protein GN956_G12178 [Arapaima gigas]
MYQNLCSQELKDRKFTVLQIMSIEKKNHKDVLIWKLMTLSWRLRSAGINRAVGDISVSFCTCDDWQ